MATKPRPKNPSAKPSPASSNSAPVRRHLVFGWLSLAGFSLVGIALESMHGFKVGWYLDVGNETRRLLLTLGHAHGVLIALVNLGFAATLASMSRPEEMPPLASPCLLAAGILMPAGFLLGGVVVYGGDPGLGIFLLPIGAALLCVGIFAAARGVLRGA